MITSNTQCIKCFFGRTKGSIPWIWFAVIPMLLRRGENRTFEEAPLFTNRESASTLINPQEDLRFFQPYNPMQSAICPLDMIGDFDNRPNESPGASYQVNGFWFQAHTNATSAYYLPESFYDLLRDSPNSSIKSTGKVYSMYGEYDYIREKLFEGKLASAQTS